MQEFYVREIKTENIKEELDLIGFDKSYVDNSTIKFKYRNIKIYNLTSTQANILKQTALSVGADCATNKNVILGTDELSDAILGGSISQVQKIAEKLKKQPFGLKTLAEKILKEPGARRTQLVGILNVTPDSFSDGGEFLSPKNAEKHLIKLVEDGADIIDIGAESTRPYSSPVSSDEQIRRIKPVLNFINKKNIKTPISIDTRSSEVAEYALDNGVNIINDVSGFDYDNKMASIVSKYGAGIIIQHSKGTPETMQNNPSYKSVIEEVYKNLFDKIQYSKSYGINNIIADVGIGFGKNKEDNIKLLDRIEEFYSLNCPIMVGISRKSFLGIKENDNNLKDTLSVAYSYPLIKKGVDFLRVHNVKLHRDLINSLYG